MSSVFISHSTREPLPEDEAGVRRHRAAMVALRNALAAAIEDAGHTPWLDKRRLGAGDVWRDGIHEALARADGAVVLLSPDALESGWVLKEATILTWMKAIGLPVAIVPVFIGVAPEEVDTLLFGPLNMTEIQAARVDADALSDETTVDAIVDEIVCHLIPHLPASQGERSPYELWVEKACVHLAGATNTELLATMLGKLDLCEGGVEPELLLADLRRFGARSDEREMARCTARQLLISDEGSVLTALRVLRDLPVDRRFVGLVTPTWFPADVAKLAPLAAANPPGSRVLVVNATDPEVGRAMVERAHCRDIETNQLLTPLEPEGTPTAEEVAGHYRRKVTDQARRALRRSLTPIYVFVGQAVGRQPRYLARMLAVPELQPFTFVVMAGSEHERVAAELEAAFGTLTDDPDLAYRDFVADIEELWPANRGAAA